MEKINDSNKSNEVQDNISMKKNKEKKIIFAGIIIILVFIIITFVVTPINIMIEEKQEAKRIASEEKKVAEEVIADAAEVFGLHDIEYDHIEYDHIEYGSLWGYVYYKSDIYDTLSDEDKLSFIVSVAEDTHFKKNIFPSGSQASGKSYDMYIISKGHIYNDFTTDGSSWLMRDNKKIFEMKTAYASSIESSLKKKLNNSSKTNESNSSNNSNSSKSNSSSSSSSSKKKVMRNYSDCYPAKPHYVCYEDGRCRCTKNP